MKKNIIAIVIMVIVYYILNSTSNVEIEKGDLEYKVEELESEIEYLKEEISGLEFKLEEAESILDNKDEYIEELQQILKENDIDKWEEINIILTDKDGNPVPPSNTKEAELKIKKNK